MDGGREVAPLEVPVTVGVGTFARRYEGAALDSLLPHRYPFLLVDRIDVIETGKRVVGSKQLSGSEWCSNEPSMIAMPFCLVLDALAQTSGALIPDLHRYRRRP